MGRISRSFLTCQTTTPWALNSCRRRSMFCWSGFIKLSGVNVRRIAALCVLDCPLRRQVSTERKSTVCTCRGIRQNSIHLRDVGRSPRRSVGVQSVGVQPLGCCDSCLPGQSQLSGIGPKPVLQRWSFARPVEGSATPQRGRILTARSDTFAENAFALIDEPGAAMEPERLAHISLGQENPRMRMNAAPG